MRDIISNQRIYCSNIENLNDPYDCNIGSADHLLGHLKKYGVFSASGPDHDEILMFSYYAGGHTGVCFEFDAETNNTIGETTFLGFARQVNYVKDFPVFTKKSIHRLPWTKYFVWQHENEYRVPADFDSDASPFRIFKKDELVGIRFGLKVDPKDQEMIISWVNEANYPKIKFYKTILCKKSFSLEYQTIYQNSGEPVASVDSQGGAAVVS